MLGIVFYCLGLMIRHLGSHRRSDIIVMIDLYLTFGVERVVFFMIGSVFYVCYNYNMGMVFFCWFGLVIRFLGGFYSYTFNIVIL